MVSEEMKETIKSLYTEAEESFEAHKVLMDKIKALLEDDEFLSLVDEGDPEVKNTFVHIYRDPSKVPVSKAVSALSAIFGLTSG